MKVVCVGDCGIDHYLPSGEQRFGGITANVARHARKQFPTEDEIHIVSCVGDDDEANVVVSSLRGLNIDCHIARLPGSTPVQYIEIDPSGERRFVRYEEGVLRDFRLGLPEQEVVANADLLVTPVYQQIVDLFDDLMTVHSGGMVAVDFADFMQHPDFDLLEKYIDKIDIGFFGLSLTHTQSISRLAKLAEEREKLFVVTLGVDGSCAFEGSERVNRPAVDVVRVCDTTGAGDAFAAGFLGRYCKGASVGEAMDRGAYLAASVVSHYGSYLVPPVVDAQ